MSNRRFLQISIIIFLEYIQPGKRSNRSFSLNSIISYRLIKILAVDMLNTNHLQSFMKDVELSRISLNELCPICFTEKFKIIFIYFDENYQFIIFGINLKNETIFRHRISMTGEFLMRKNLSSILKLLRLIII